MASIEDNKLYANCFVRLERLTDQQILRYDRNYLRKPYIDECEPNNEDIKQSEFMRYLSLVPKHRLDTTSLQTLHKDFPVRRIGRIEEQLTNETNDLILDSKAIIKTISVQNKRPGLVLKTKPKRRKRLIPKKITKDIQKQKKIEIQTQLRNENNEKKRINSLITRFPITSVMSNRLIHTFCDQSEESTEGSDKAIEIPDYPLSSSNTKFSTMFLSKLILFWLVFVSLYFSKMALSLPCSAIDIGLSVFGPLIFGRSSFFKNIIAVSSVYPFFTSALIGF